MLAGNHPELNEQSRESTAVFEPLLSRHFTVSELANAWNVSEDTVRREFLNEPDVVVISHRRRDKRIYRTIRIPAKVAARVYRRLMKSAASNNRSGLF